MKKKVKFLAGIAFLSLIGFAITACDSPTGGTPPVMPASVTLTPIDAYVVAGGTQQFSAAVTPAAASQALTWSVVPETAGSITAGLLRLSGAHAGQIVTVRATASGHAAIYREATVTVTAPGHTPEPEYSISLNVMNIHTFPTALFGTTVLLRTVRIENTGNQPTGQLTVALSGANPGSFALTGSPITNIAVGGYAEFTVGPNQDLPVGTYTATVTVSGGAGITASFGVSFTVSETPPVPSFSITLIPAGDFNFGSVHVGYTSVQPHTVTIENTGNQPTGQLTVALSGANPASFFTVNSSSIGSIAVGGHAIFTVGPNPGLPVGIYTATVTVSGANITAQSFTVSFTVTEPPIFCISLDTGDHTFTTVEAGYDLVTPHTVRITNTGNQATGQLTVALSGANPGFFALTGSPITNIAVGGHATFTVGPIHGLPVGTHTATVTVSVGVGITSQTFTVSFEVTEIPAFGISLDTDNHIFAPVQAGYDPVIPRTVRITNTGNQPTGQLAVALSGTNPGSFALTGYTIDSIGAGGDATFTVGPRYGLAVGTHTATVTVSGGAGITASFDVSFTVTVPPTFGISLDTTGDHTFTTVEAGYDPVTPHTVRITNTGNQATGQLTVALSGANPGSFALTGYTITNIAAEGHATFTVGPRYGLAVGTHTATVTVSGGTGMTASFDVSFTVTVPPTFSISLDTTGDHTFTTVEAGYDPVTPHTVRITNTGNQATGQLTVALSGANHGSFTVIGSPITNIAVGGHETFTVGPNPGLQAGTYTATVTVSGANITAQSFTVSFEVTAPIDIGTIPGYLQGTWRWDRGAWGHYIVWIVGTSTVMVRDVNDPGRPYYSPPSPPLHIESVTRGEASGEWTTYSFTIEGLGNIYRELHADGNWLRDNDGDYDDDFPRIFRRIMTQGNR